MNSEPYFHLTPVADAAQIACGGQPLLPPYVREELKRVSAIDDPKNRTKAINRVVERARLKYPHLFRTD